MTIIEPGLMAVWWWFFLYIVLNSMEIDQIYLIF